MIETLVLCGRTCAGKTVGGAFLSNRFDVPHIEASSIMRELWVAAADGKSVDEFAKQMLVQAPNRVPAEALRRARGMPVVITGLRSPDEVAEVRRLRPGVRIVFVEATAATRFRRILDRARPGHPRTMPEFRVLDQIHEEMGIADISADSSVVTLRNELSVERYYELLEQTASMPCTRE